MIKPSSFYSSGKLMLTGEYAVLHGAKALAVPTKFGQHLTVSPYLDGVVKWESYDINGNCWFQTKFPIQTLKPPMRFKGNVDQKLKYILKTLMQINPATFSNNKGFYLKSALEFDRDWGLGSSSTLINNLAMWTESNPFTLLHQTFGGSGYDIACAQKGKPLIYSIENKAPKIEVLPFNPPFSSHLYFVYLNKKQNSQKEVAGFLKKEPIPSNTVLEINHLTNAIVETDNVEEFSTILQQHEKIIGHCINQTPIKDRSFFDFNGTIKSLGAWGGDFVMAVSQTNPSPYFYSRGYGTVLPYSSIIKP